MYKVTKDSKEILELKDPQVNLDARDLQEGLAGQELREKGEILDSRALQVAMDSQEGLDYRVHQGRSVNLDRMELKEMLEHLVKKDSRDPRDL